jgi:hypothetical protein
MGTLFLIRMAGRLQSQIMERFPAINSIVSRVVVAEVLDFGFGVGFEQGVGGGFDGEERVAIFRARDHAGGFIRQAGYLFQIGQSTRHKVSS